jgi:hypothetical protein
MRLDVNDSQLGKFVNQYLWRKTLTTQTDKKFESHFRVPLHVLSIGFHVLIPLGWAQMLPIRPSRRPRITCQRDRGHGVRSSGRTSPWLEARTPPNTPSSRGVQTEAQANRPCSKRAGVRGGGSAASLRWLRIRRMTDTVLMSPAEVDEATKRTISYRPPGAYPPNETSI